MPMSQEERLREQSAAEGVPDQARTDEQAEQAVEQAVAEAEAEARR